MLTIGLDHTKKEPFYRQIYAYIRDEIRSGARPCGSKLPSTRRLAKHMDLSRNTIDLAYGQLTAEGYIEAKPKCGYFVCQVEDLASLNIPVETEEEEKHARIAKSIRNGYEYHGKILLKEMVAGYKYTGGD